MEEEQYEINQQKYRPPTSKEQIVNYYHQYFHDVLLEVRNHDINSITKSIKQSHRIQVIPPEKTVQLDLIKHGNIYIQVKKIKSQGLQCIYEAIVGQFFLVIRMLNIQRNAQSQSNQMVSLGKGSFGVVKQVSVNNHNIAVKKIGFNNFIKKQVSLPYLLDQEDFAEPFGIRNAIKQYCIYKICSMLKIGPQVIFTDVYDIVCYNDCIEFQMELCQTIGNCSYTSYQFDLKYCIALLHSLKFVHKDIKPSNVVYSPTLKRYVMTDFGISNSVREQLWQKSQTYFQGSYHYCSPQMQEIHDSDSLGLVNLYLNDIYSLKITIEEIRNCINMNNQNFSKNQMSIMVDGESYEGQYDSMASGESIINEESYKFTANQGTQQVISEQSYRQSTLQSTSSDFFMNFSNEINFYIIRSLFKIQKLDKIAITPQSTKDIIKNVCCHTSQQQIAQNITVIIIQMLFPKDAATKHINRFRNFVRIFGLYSKQVIQLAENIYEQRKIPQINNQKLKKFIISSKKHSNYFSLKKITINDLDRYSTLTNFRLLGSSLNYFIKLFKRQEMVTLQNNKQAICIANHCLTVFENGLTDKKILIHIRDFIEILVGKKIPKTDQFFIDIQKSLQVLYQFYQKQQLLTQQNSMKFFRAFYRINKSDTITYQKRALQNVQNISQKFIIESNLESFSKMNKHDKINWAKHKNFELQSLLKLKRFKQAQQLINQHREHFREMDIVKQKMKFFQMCIMLHSYLKQYKQLQQINQYCLQIKKQYYFPRENGIEYSFNYFHKAVVDQFLYQNRQSAIRNYRYCIEYSEQTIKSFYFSEATLQAYNNLCLCLQKENRIEQVAQNLQKCYSIMEIYSQCKPQDILYILKNLISVYLKLNRINQNLLVYIDRLVNLKHDVLLNRFDFPMNVMKKIPLFHFVGLQGYSTLETIIQAKKMFVCVSKQCLPLFMNFYCLMCDDIAQYYFNTLKTPLKAQPYLWKFFDCQPKIINNKDFYEKFNLHIEMLLRSNSTRRALKLLKTYAYTIPNELIEFQNEIFKKMSKISKQLLNKDRLFYVTIWKQKAYLNKTNYNLCYKKFGNIKNEIIGLCYQKKLRKVFIQPHFQKQSFPQQTADKLEECQEQLRWKKIITKYYCKKI